jgi:CRP/FNR family cyclic AMP-dependent transcriptional regulator
MLPHRKSAQPLQLDAEAIERFIQHCSIRAFAAKDFVFRPGDPGGQLIYVIKGKLSIVTSEEDHDDEQLILGYMNEGDFIGEASLFVPVETRSVSLLVNESAELAMIECSELLDLMQGALAPDAAKLLYALGTQLSRRLLETSRKASGLALLDVAGRIWRALEDLTHQPGAMTHPRGIQIKTSRQELARIAGCSREMAGRVIRQFVAEGKMSAAGKTMVLFR